MSKLTIQDVAKLAGVGTSTVSRVINNRPNISEEAREQVLRAVEALGYIPNPAARRFRTGQTHAVSVLLPLLGTEFYSKLFERMQRVFEEAEMDMAMFPVLKGIILKRYRDAHALPYHADGMVIVSLEPDRLYEGGQPPFAKPVVLVDAHHPKYHSVYFDNFAAGRMAAQCALGSGLPVAVVGVEKVPEAFESQAHREREQGIMHTLTRQGISPVMSLQVPFSTEGGRWAADRLIAGGLPKGSFIVATTDEVAIGVMKGCAQQGWQLGRDVKVMGFDDSSAAQEFGLTTIHQPVGEMGHAAAEVLLDALEGKLKVIEQRCFAPRLVVRESA